MTFERRNALMKPLSATEMEVLQHLADGVSTAEIAASRSTTAQVIKNYTYRACQKLGADNRANDEVESFFYHAKPPLSCECGNVLVPGTIRRKLELIRNYS